MTSQPAPDTPAPQGAKSPARPQRRNALLERLQAEFAVFRDYKPLAIGIHKQLMERLPDLDKNKMRVALHSHTASTRYLKALTEGAPRLDLDGQPAGEVTAEQQSVAVQTLRDRLKKAAERRKEEEEAAKRQVKLQQLADKFSKR
ncbi:MAG: ProQ/FinO family protein [Pseudomonadota bacterium]